MAVIHEEEMPPLMDAVIHPCINEIMLKLICV